MSKEKLRFLENSLKSLIEEKEKLKDFKTKDEALFLDEIRQEINIKQRTYRVYTGHYYSV